MNEIEYIYHKCCYREFMYVDAKLTLDILNIHASRNWVPYKCIGHNFWLGMYCGH